MRKLQSVVSERVKRDTHQYITHTYSKKTEEERERAYRVINTPHKHAE